MERELRAKSAGGKGSTAAPTPAPPPPNCKNCLFNVIYDELAAVQITNGSVVNFEQVKGTSGQVAICDTCKCAGNEPQKVAASYEAECDEELGVDVKDEDIGEMIIWAEVAANNPINKNTWQSG